MNGDLVNVDQSTVSRIVKKVSFAIAGLRPDYINMPETHAEIIRTKNGFYNMVQPHGIPNVVGLIDCTHVKIYSPGGIDAERYRNRKGYFSINVQLVGRYDLKILDIVARWPGSTHDSQIFDRSLVKVNEFNFFKVHVFNFPLNVEADQLINIKK